jgi:hypothetical protein
LLARFDEASPGTPGWSELPLLELDPEVDTTFERVVLVGAATLAGAVVLSAVSGLLGFLLGLFVAA